MGPFLVGERRYYSNMLANVVDTLKAGIDALGEVDWAGMPVRERLENLEALETIIRRARAASGTALAALACETTETLGDRPHKVIADRLRISPAEARRRLREAGLVAERATLTGQPVPPILEGTAKHWHGGVLDPEHVKVIAGTLAELPADTPFDKRQWAESFLADKAAQLRPDQLAKVAQRLAATINPDGNFSDVDRARKRGVVIGRQHTDGMSPITGWLNPELRASLDAVLGKLAAPGMCNPEDQAPRVDDDPDPEVAGRDGRSTAQRNHDALLAMCRSNLASGELGSHHGPPVTMVSVRRLHGHQEVAVVWCGSVVQVANDRGGLVVQNGLLGGPSELSSAKAFMRVDGSSTGGLAHLEQDGAARCD